MAIGDGEAVDCGTKLPLWQVFSPPFGFSDFTIRANWPTASPPLCSGPSGDSVCSGGCVPNREQRSATRQGGSNMDNIDIVKVVLVRDRELSHKRFTIRSADDVFTVVSDYLDGADREHFIVVVVDTKHVVNAIHTVSIGTLDATLVFPREVFKVAILANASGIIVAHNHPSGSPEPSKEDITITQRLKEAGKILGIDVIDHLVIGDGCFTSLLERGYL